jgi:hypothetical protein
MAGFGGGSLGNGIAGMSSGAGGTGAAVGETTLNAGVPAGGFANTGEFAQLGTQTVPSGNAAIEASDYAINSANAAPAGGIGDLATGLQNIGQEGSWDAFKAGMGGAGGPATNTQAALAIGMPAGMSYLAGAMPPVPGENEEDKYDPKRTLSLNTNTGLKLLAQGGMTTGGSTSVYGNQDGTAAQNTLKESYGLGRLNTLAAANTTANAEMGGFAKGGYLDGAGDGMSDSIPATIEGKQPARLADGEFVIPADVVSHLGNGSTKAGAQHLYKMLDKVRKARTGNKKQGKQINPSKYLPA